MKITINKIVKTEVEVLGCPFCGNDNVKLDSTILAYKDGRLKFIRCNICDAMGPKCEDMLSAVEAWNSALRGEIFSAHCKAEH